MMGLLDVVTSSEKRRNVLLLLHTGPKSWDEIKDTLDVTSTGMLPQIKILINHDLVTKENGIYSLTSIGHVITNFLVPFNTIIYTFDNTRDYFLNHDFSVLPISFQHNFGEVNSVKIDNIHTAEIFLPHKEFLENVSRSKTIAGIFPVIYPSYPILLLDRAKEGTEIIFITTSPTFTKMKNEFPNEIKQFLDQKNFKIYVSDDDIRFVCIATDDCLWLSFFTKNGAYDPATQLISKSQSSRQWGEKLANYFIHKSLEITVL